MIDSSLVVDASHGQSHFWIDARLLTRLADGYHVHVPLRQKVRYGSRESTDRLSHAGPNSGHASYDSLQRPKAKPTTTACPEVNERDSMDGQGIIVISFYPFLFFPRVLLRSTSSGLFSLQASPDSLGFLAAFYELRRTEIFAGQLPPISHQQRRGLGNPAGFPLPLSLLLAVSTDKRGLSPVRVTSHQAACPLTLRRKGSAAFPMHKPLFSQQSQPAGRTVSCFSLSLSISLSCYLTFPTEYWRYSVLVPTTEGALLR